MYAPNVRGFVRRGLSTKTGSQRPAEPSVPSSPALVPAVLVPPHRASEAVKRAAPTPKGKGPPPLTNVEAHLEGEDDDGIEELEASNLLSASEPPAEQLVDPEDVMDAPPSNAAGSRALAEVVGGAAKASGTLIGIGRAETNAGPNHEANRGTNESDPPARIPVIDPSVFRADEIASASLRAADGERKPEKAKTAPVVMPRKREERALVPERRGGTKVMAVVAAALVLGAGLALLGISAREEPQKPRAITTTEVPPIAPSPPTGEPVAAAVPPATATATATATPTAPTAPTATAKLNAPVATAPRTTAAAATGAEKTSPPRGAAPPPGLEFLKTDL